MHENHLNLQSKSIAKNFLAKALARWEPEVIIHIRVIFINMPPSWQVEAMLRERRRILMLAGPLSKHSKYYIKLSVDVFVVL